MINLLLGYCFFINGIYNFNKIDSIPFVFTQKKIAYRQVESEPLIYLYNKTNLNEEDLKDSKISNRLRLLGYKNGINDLDNYYVDYFNKNYAADFKNIYELPVKFLNKIWSQESKKQIKETNQDLVNVYNETWYQQTMVANNDITYGKVYTFYLDTLGNFLSEKVVMQDVINSNYYTDLKEFSGYQLKSIQGLEKGTYSKDDKYVYYIYDVVPSYDAFNEVKDNLSGSLITWQQYMTISVSLTIMFLSLIGVLYVKKW